MEQGTTTTVAGTDSWPAGPSDVVTFAGQLGRLTGDQIEGLATALRAEMGSAEGEVLWWRATMGVDRSLRCARRGRMAGAAAHDASTAVLRAADAAGIRTTSRDAVTMVARAASDVARALVAAGGSPACPAAAIPAWRAVLDTVDLRH